MSSSPTTFTEIATMIQQFREERDRTHLAPVDLAKSIMLEAAELLEHYQRDQTLEKRGQQIPPKDMQKIAKEVADIQIYLMEFCHDTGIDLVDATIQKIKKNAEKYPVDNKTNGKHDHEAYLKIKQQYRTEGKN